jgi:hypothetical protein
VILYCSFLAPPAFFTISCILFGGLRDRDSKQRVDVKFQDRPAFIRLSDCSRGFVSICAAIGEHVWPRTSDMVRETGEKKISTKCSVVQHRDEAGICARKQHGSGVDVKVRRLRYCRGGERNHNNNNLTMSRARRSRRTVAIAEEGSDKDMTNAQRDVGLREGS